jgi:hypothetical protein
MRNALDAVISKLKVNQGEINKSLDLCAEQQTVYAKNHLPTLKSETYVWDENMHFDIKKTNITYTIVKVRNELIL